MTLQHVRKLILDNKIEDGLKKLIDLSPFPKRDHILGLLTQFNNWENNYHKNLDAPIEERNRIIYACFQTITVIEKEKATGKKRKQLEKTEAAEENLSQVFEQLTSLSQYGTLDLFMLWFLDTQPDLFQEMKRQEVHFGKVLDFKSSLSKLNLGLFISKHQMMSEDGNLLSNEIIEAYILSKYSAIPEFFTKWDNYHKDRIKQKSILTNTVKVLVHEYKGFLKTIVSGSVGGVLAHILIDNLDSLIGLDESENGIDDLDDIDVDPNDEDFDD